jgi:Immunity protein 51
MRYRGRAVAKTTFETSESFPSPSGIHRASVSSQKSSRGDLSQAMVERPDGGSGLVAFYRRRVSMAFVWKGDYELVIRYPSELPAPRIDATNRSFGRGGRGKVIYEAVPGSDIKPLRWTRTGELRVTATEQLERGALLTFETNGRVDYSYSYYDVREPDSSVNELLALGLQAGGETWAGIIQGLVALRAPTLAKDLDFDPEADGLAVRSTSRAVLVRVAKLVAAAKRKRSLLVAAIERARLDGRME